MTRLMLTGVLTLALGAALTPAAKAGDYTSSGGDCCAYRKVVCLQTVVVYETRTVAYTKPVTAYDECGAAYTVQKTCYRTARVPVKKVQAVVKYVKVCD